MWHETQQLLAILKTAILQIRHLARQNNPDNIAEIVDLADMIHNIPAILENDASKPHEIEYFYANFYEEFLAKYPHHKEHFL